MVHEISLLVILVRLVDRIPTPPPPAERQRGRPRHYTDRLFLKALVSMIVKHLHTPYELLSVLQQDTAAMAALRQELTQDGRYPSRRTWAALIRLTLSLQGQPVTTDAVRAFQRDRLGRGR